MRHVPAATGFEWLRRAFLLLRAHPAPLLSMGAILTVIALVPLVGILVMLFLGAALLGGIVFAAREAEAGRTPRVGQLFQAFHEGDRVGSLVALCLPLLAAFAVAVFVIGIPLASAVAQGQLSLEQLRGPGAAEALEAALGGRVFPMMLTMLVLVVLVGMLTFFAVPDIMLGKRGAFEAMRRSLRACVHNLGAFLLAVLVLGVGLQLLNYLLSLLLPPLLAGVLVNIPYYALFGPLLYVAWSDVYGTDRAESERAAAPPSPPSPPSPPPSFEA